MYASTAEYRQFLRSICSMEPNRMYVDSELDVTKLDASELDDETLDEFEYDEDATRSFLDGIYTLTNGCEAFRQLYVATAALMFSTDEQIGLAVLCSYDYLADFYACIEKYRKCPAAFDYCDEVDVEEYQRLYRKLHK